MGVGSLCSCIGYLKVDTKESATQAAQRLFAQNEEDALKIRVESRYLKAAA